MIGRRASKRSSASVPVLQQAWFKSVISEKAQLDPTKDKWTLTQLTFGIKIHTEKDAALLRKNLCGLISSKPFGTFFHSGNDVIHAFSRFCDVGF